jgi:hypothetical protein
MAAEWIKWTKGLARKPEVLQIASRLGVSRHAAVGILMEVWEWADDNVVIDDSASGFDPDNCPGSVRLGDQSASLFDATFGVPGLADAMTAVGWIAIRSGSLVFPNFARHNGKSAKARALDSARKRTARQSSPASVPIPSGSQPDRTRIRGEEKREERREDPPNPPPAGAEGATEPMAHPPPAKRKPKSADPGPESVPIPRDLDAPDFRAAWAEWIADRKARGRFTARAAELQFEKLLPLGPAKAAACVRESIANGWSGLFPDKFRTGPPPPARSKADRAQEQLEAEIEACFGGTPPGDPA